MLFLGLLFAEIVVESYTSSCIMWTNVKQKRTFGTYLKAACCYESQFLSQRTR